MPHFESPRSLDILMAADDRLRSISHHGKLTVSCSSLNARLHGQNILTLAAAALQLVQEEDEMAGVSTFMKMETKQSSNPLNWHDNQMDFHLPVLRPNCFACCCPEIRREWKCVTDCPTFFKTHFIFTLSLYFSYGIFACGCVSKV